MPGGSKEQGSKDAKALDYVKTQQRAEAESEKRTASAKAEKASRPQEADPTHDSPKRQGDKLANARDAAAGKGKGK